MLSALPPPMSTSFRALPGRAEAGGAAGMARMEADGGPRLLVHGIAGAR